MFPFLSNHGVLGLNARNLLYLKPYNPKKAVAFADNKLKSKAYLSARGIPVAKIYARVEDRVQLRAFDFGSLPDECVLKPNNGFGGEGIVILKGRKNGVFFENGRTPITDERLREHIEDILDGKFSVNGREDTAFFEKILVAHEGFAPFRPAGLPDVRIIVFNLVPVMAMVRVPTALSGGKANVHQGGIGIGIDLAKGITTHGFQYDHLIKELPHGAPVAGIPIPFWEDLLLIASRIQTITNIGYLAVDLTIDEDQGPVLLEVNARAGLGVQLANLAPLRARLERVKGIDVGSPEKGVRLAQDLFGQRVQKSQDTDDRPRLGLQESILIHGDGSTIKVRAALAPGVYERSQFAPDLIRDLLQQEAIEHDEETGLYRAKFTLGGRKIQTVVESSPINIDGVRAILGRRDLRDFLIDPSRRPVDNTVVPTRVVSDLRSVDRILSQFDRDLLVLRHLKPLNLQDERQRIIDDPLYTPIFTYAALEFDPDDVEKRLWSLSIDESPLGLLLKKKRLELVMRLEALKSRGDAARFTEASKALFGAPTAHLLLLADAALQSRIACELPPPAKEWLSAERAAPLFEEHFRRYGLHDWHVTIRDTLIADCTVGWKHLYIRSDARFTKQHVASLVAHEIETHVLTLENGEQQPYELFRRGFANYLDTQEGLAVYNQNRILPPFEDKRYGPARSVLAVEYSLHHPFVETRQYLEKELGYTTEKAVTKAIELKRGLGDTSQVGSFTKGLVYFRGQLAVENFVQNGGDLRRLYIGKVAVEDLELAEKVPGIKAPLLVPGFLRRKDEDK